MLTLRIGYVVVVMALVVWLLLTGLPLGAVAVAILAVWARRAVEAGRFARSRA